VSIHRVAILLLPALLVAAVVVDDSSPSRRIAALLAVDSSEATEALESGAFAGLRLYQLCIQRVRDDPQASTPAGFAERWQALLDATETGAWLGDVSLGRVLSDLVSDAHGGWREGVLSDRALGEWLRLLCIAHIERAGVATVLPVTGDLDAEGLAAAARAVNSRIGMGIPFVPVTWWINAPGVPRPALARSLILLTGMRPSILLDSDRGLCAAYDLNAVGAWVRRLDEDLTVDPALVGFLEQRCAELTGLQDVLAVVHGGHMVAFLAYLDRAIEGLQSAPGMTAVAALLGAQAEAACDRIAANAVRAEADIPTADGVRRRALESYMIVAGATAERRRADGAAAALDDFYRDWLPLLPRIPDMCPLFIEKAPPVERW